MKWGFQLDASVEAQEPININTETNPVAGIQVVVRYRIRSMLADYTEARPYFMQGDGVFTEILPAWDEPGMPMWLLDPELG